MPQNLFMYKNGNGEYEITDGIGFAWPMPNKHAAQIICDAMNKDKVWVRGCDDFTKYEQMLTTIQEETNERVG